MKPEDFLDRIKYNGRIEPDFESLEALHLAHMYTVPFENLDIRMGIPIELGFEEFYSKIVDANRGGFCYELNGLFGWLLTKIGFEVEMLSARVYGQDGAPGPDFDHMLLHVNKEFIADVGFGDSFTRPLKFREGDQEQESGVYRLVSTGNTWQMERNSGEGFKPQYLFTETPRALNEYEEMCIHQQTSPKSTFTQKVVCSLATPNGRITYANGRTISTVEGEKSEAKVEGIKELATLLENTFGIKLDGGYGALLGKAGVAQ
ncbi:MAG: arylamine N-acetyltransferase [Pyrinomonadaceae bacterium]|nr:arylamine N-acetyltransferase [Pyrinomonadaceae bacterium]